MKQKRFFIGVLFLMTVVAVFSGCRTKGCLDPNALNYDPEARVYDGNCEYPDPSTQIVVRVSMESNGEVVKIDDEFVSPGINKLKITNFKFYLSNFEATSSGGGSQSLSSVALFDMDSNAVESANANKFYNVAAMEVPSGTYTSLDFDLGINQDENETLPSDYDLGHPLSDETMWWGWAAQRKFVEIDGVYDIDGDGVLEVDDRSIFFHTGTAALFKNVSPISVDVTLAENQKQYVDLIIDLDVLFTQLDLTQRFQTHTTGDSTTVAIADEFNAALATSFRID